MPLCGGTVNFYAALCAVPSRMKGVVINERKCQKII